MRVSPAPIREPITPDPDALVQKGWVQWFRQLSLLGAMSGTHEKRPSAGPYPDGTFYFESDRNAFYLAIGGKWRYMAGMMVGQIGQRPEDLGEEDTGFSFYLDDWSLQYLWAGGEWKERP